MKKTTSNLVMLNCIFVTSLIVANIVSCKVVTFWVFTVPAAIVAYPLTFLMTDVIGEIWGREEANRTVRKGFICQLVSLILIGAAILLPIAPFADIQKEFQTVLMSTFRVVLASMIAYLCSQSWDVFIFHKIKAKSDRYKWIRNNVSTMSSQIIDTAIFITIAFYGTVPSILAMILSQYGIKVIYAVLDTPFFYLLTKKEKNNEIEKRSE